MSSKLSPFPKLRFHSKRRMTTLTVHQKSLSLSVRTGSYTIREKTGSRKEVLWSSPGYGEGERKSLPSCLVSKKLSFFYFTSTVSIAFLQHFVNHWLTYGPKRKINAWMFCVCPHNLSKHVISRARVGRLCTTIDRKHHVHIFKKWQAMNLFYQTLCTNIWISQSQLYSYGRRLWPISFYGPTSLRSWRPVSLVREPYYWSNQVYNDLGSESISPFLPVWRGDS